jgi:uncharacterized protein with HEPN domain
MPRDQAALADIVDACREAMGFLQGLGYEAFQTDARTRAALLYELLVIGEASTRVSEDLRTRTLDVPWVKIGNLRNILVHDYDRVDLGRIWGIATTELPQLVARLSPLITTGALGDRA